MQVMSILKFFYKFPHIVSNEMIKIGQVNTLTVIKKVPFGLYLDGADWGEILLPSKFVPQGTDVHDRLDVFIYFDSEDKIIATTKRPRAEINTVAYLKVVDVNQFGAFLDWGLDKDLLVPRAEQQRPMEKDKSYIVYIKQDNQQRLIGSAKIDYFLDKSIAQYKLGDEVDLLIAETSDMGVKVIINDKYWGLIHATEIFQTLSYGKKMRGYIKTLRADGKIDVSLRKMGQDSVRDLAKRILLELQNKNGFLPLHDKSTPLEIKQAFGESKSNFKSAIGSLYKAGEITIEQDGIRVRCKDVL